MSNTDDFKPPTDDDLTEALEFGGWSGRQISEWIAAHDAAVLQDAAKSVAAYLAEHCTVAEIAAGVRSAFARVWDEGYEAGEQDGYLMGRDEPFDETTPNPYASEETP